jgi:hypothetical protein
MSETAEPPPPERPPPGPPPPEWARTEPTPGFAPLDDPRPTAPQPPTPYAGPPTHPYAQPPPPYGQPQYGQPQYGQPQYAPPAYGSQGYGPPPTGYPTGYVPYQYGYGAPRTQTTNGLAIASLVCGIVSILGPLACLVLSLAGIAGLICGTMSLRQLKRAVVPQQGRGMAIGGIVTSAVGLAGLALMLLFFGALIFGGFFGAD